jgi:hypothetical protein
MNKEEEEDCILAASRAEILKRQAEEMEDFETHHRVIRKVIDKEDMIQTQAVKDKYAPELAD